MNRRMLAAMIAGVVAVTSVAACGTTAGTATIPGATTSPPGSSSGATAASPSDESGTLFDSSSVHSISVTFDQAAYDAMIETYQSSGEKEWISATVTIDGTVFENVGIKLKGNSSLGGLGGAGGPGGPPGFTDPDSDASSPSPSTAAPDTTAESPGTATPDSTATDAPDPTAEQPTEAQPQDGRVMNGAGGGVSEDEPEGLPWRIKLDKFVEGQNHQGETDIVVRGNNSETSLN
jgi:spore coat protein CotH